jgi:hypothetical protein
MCINFALLEIKSCVSNLKHPLVGKCSGHPAVRDQMFHGITDPTIICLKKRLLSSLFLWLILFLKAVSITFCSEKNSLLLV